jgi:dienelactone hydrolase
MNSKTNHHRLRAVVPGKRAWRGAAWGGGLTVVATLLVTAYGLAGTADPGWLVASGLFLLAAIMLAGALLMLIWRIGAGLPALFVWALAAMTLALLNLALIGPSVVFGIFSVGLGVFAAAALTGAGIASLRHARHTRLTPLQRRIAAGGLVLGLSALIGGSFWLLDEGTPRSLAPGPVGGPAAPPLDLPDPAQPGPYTVHTLFYGSGQDRRRAEFGAAVDLVTPPVDGSALLERWSGLRARYWGFGPEALPLNARVWYPEPTAGTAAPGPYPLVLIVHGQHAMEEPSDPGYAYLGELLASRGFIAASIDQNFLNLSALADLLLFQSLNEPDDVRAWLLLEHLRLWRAWNAEPASRFYQRVDMERIGLIGHSRGGEAVAVAATLNRLPANPDNGAMQFDYGFDIRAVAAFAPAEGMNRPAGQAPILRDLNYLVLHGAHDMDVFTFQGSRQYARVHFSDPDSDQFKAALYIDGANHGQFNTVWGRKDFFEPLMRIFNLEQLISAAEQRRIAEVSISAFLEAALHDKADYRAFFQNPQRGREWLPNTTYVHQYADAATQWIATYEEDIDLFTTTLTGGRLAGEGLTLWREGPVPARWGVLGDQAVHLRWDATTAPTPASYTVQIAERSLAVGASSVLVFDIADTREHAELPIDLTIEVTDSAGATARLALSRYGAVQPRLPAQLGKAGFMSPFASSEAVLQHVALPLADFVAANSGFDPAGLVQIGLLFDRTPEGAIVLDNIGLR